MEFEQLTKEEQQKWHDWAASHQKFLNFAKGVERDGCWLCSHKLARWNEFEFHMFSTHGIPRDVLKLNWME